MYCANGLINKQNFHTKSRVQESHTAQQENSNILVSLHSTCLAMPLKQGKDRIIFHYNLSMFSGKNNPLQEDNVTDKSQTTTVCSNID